MIANYGICRNCTDLIENKAGLWRDIDGHSFSLMPIEETGQFVYHVHSPMEEKTYRGVGKYSCLDAEILHCLSLLGYGSEETGEADTFGFYEFFPDYSAILTEDSQGFVSVKRYDDAYRAQDEWNCLSGEYSDFLDSEEAELEYERRDIDASYYDEYDSDLYDVYED